MDSEQPSFNESGMSFFKTQNPNREIMEALY